MHPQRLLLTDTRDFSVVFSVDLQWKCFSSGILFTTNFISFRSTQANPIANLHHENGIENCKLRRPVKVSIVVSIIVVISEKDSAIEDIKWWKMNFNDRCFKGTKRKCAWRVTYNHLCGYCEQLMQFYI